MIARLQLRAVDRWITRRGAGVRIGREIFPLTLMPLDRNRLYSLKAKHVIRPNGNSRDLSMMIRKVLRDLTPASTVTIQHVIRRASNDTLIESAALSPEVLRVIERVLRIHGGSDSRSETYIQAPEVARLLGIKTDTLAKWRRHDRGPKEWIRTSATSVSYPASEVDSFLRAWKEKSNPICP
jgi:predicted DNA-binding transcriptional regulator AlpA